MSLFTKKNADLPDESKDNMDFLDLDKRYDLHCFFQNQLYIYRNVLIKGKRKLMKEEPLIFAEFLVVEDENGKEFILHSVLINCICEPGYEPKVDKLDL